MIAGRAFVKCELLNGVPTVRRVDPRNMIFDINSSDDFLSDGTFFGEVRFMNIGDAAQQYNLTQKEIVEVYNSYKRDSRMASNNLLVDTAKGSALTYFKWDRGELRVLVLSAVWIDYKDKKKKYSKDQYENEHVKEVPDTKEGENIKTKTIKTWRQGTLIGGKIMREWGEIENQVRSIDDFYESDCPYKACLPNWLNRMAISKVDILKALQKIKNITMYNIQLAMSRAGAKGFVYDMAQIPDEWDVKTVIKYLKVVGIAFIDSTKDGIAKNFNQFGPVDQTISDSVEKYIKINDMLDREMDAVSGINEARQGLVQNSSQAVGVTQSALVQSSLSTESLNSEFQMFASNVWTYLGGLFRWADKNKFAPVISETGINFLEQEIDYELDDYGVFIEEINPILQDVQAFQSYVTAALQSGAIDFVDALKLMREKDMTKAIREFEKAYNKKAQQAEKQAQAQQEQQMAYEADQQQKQLDNQLQSQGVANKGKQDVEVLKGKHDLRDTLAKGRIDMRNTQLQGLIDKDQAKDKAKAEKASKPANKAK